MSVEEIKKKFNSAEQFSRLRRRLKYNEVISDFYEIMAEKNEETVWSNDGTARNVPSLVLTGKAKNVKNCCGYWEIDYYPKQRVKDLIRTNLCRDRFCDNCQHVAAVRRANKYEPLLDVFTKFFDIYHVVFTVPNVPYEQLDGTLDKMYKHIGYMFRLFRGNAKIRGIDFEQYGFQGGIRALEITREKARANYLHPHFHCLIVFKKGLKLDENRTHITSFSYDDEDYKRRHRKKIEGEVNRYFSDFEIMLQKIWRLRYDGVKVNVKNIDELDEGYSVWCEEAKGNYKEVFKYALKGLFKKRKATDDGCSDIGFFYNEFEALYQALRRRRIIQGYGELYGLKFDDPFEDESEENAIPDEEYYKIIAELQEVESPQRLYEFLHTLRKEEEEKKITFISKNTINEVLQREEKDEGEWELK